jgi:hypothetical protein
MLKLTRKLIILSVLVVTLATASFAPASTKHRIDVFCFDGPITEDCMSGRTCCDLSGNCTCGQ